MGKNNFRVYQNTWKIVLYVKFMEISSHNKYIYNFIYIFTDLHLLHVKHIMIWGGPAVIWTHSRRDHAPDIPPVFVRFIYATDSIEYCSIYATQNTTSSDFILVLKGHIYTILSLLRSKPYKIQRLMSMDAYRIVVKLKFMMT